MESELQQKCLESFPNWLASLATDATALSELLEGGDLQRHQVEILVGGLNYFFKSLDLIPDGMEDIGYVDDAFVLRVAAELALRAGAPELPVLSRLEGEAELVRDFLDKDYARLTSYVTQLKRTAARGRTVSEILDDVSIRRQFISEIVAFGRSFEAPTFAKEPKTLIKLRAFLDTKLPQIQA